jgi:hypothetical protein
VIPAPIRWWLIVMAVSLLVGSIPRAVRPMRSTMREAGTAAGVVAVSRGYLAR